jgi:hypothetical protein
MSPKFVIFAILLLLLGIIMYFSIKMSPFPKLKGLESNEAQRIIRSKGLVPVIMTPGQPWTRDLQTNRVRIIVESGVVTNEPTIG